MKTKGRLTQCVLIPALLALCGAARGQQTVMSSPRPVADAILKIEKHYGWPITYEDPPWIYDGDLEDVTARVRTDGRSAGEGVPRILQPRGGDFVLRLEDAVRPARGTRSPETAARAAILAMLKSYSDSVGGVEIFALTESDGLFHVVPVQRKNGSGTPEKVVPLLDTPISISTPSGDVSTLVDEICRSLTGPAGTRVGMFTVWQPATTSVVPKPGEAARSVLSRLLAEQSWPTPTSWALLYEPTWGYMLHVHRVDTSAPR